MRSSGDGEIDVDLLSWWRHQPFVDHCADEGDHCADEGLAQVEQVQPCASRAAQPRHPSPQPPPGESVTVRLRRRCEVRPRHTLTYRLTGNVDRWSVRPAGP